MFPIKDNIKSRTFPAITISLILANILVFAMELSKGNELMQFIGQYGFVPARFFNSLFTFTWNPSQALLPAFTSMFLHGGWLHLISNCWYLWIFGDNVEDRLGHLGFLGFYILCGLLALAAQSLVAPFSILPNIGASGAIAGVMGAYIFLFPRAKIVILFPIFIFFKFFEVRAMFFLGFWVIMQYLNSVSSLSAASGVQGGVAWWAHLGGFVAGAILVWSFKKKLRS